MSLLTYLYIVLAGCAFIFVLQHIGRKQGWKYTPGYFIDLVATFFEKVWAKIGRLCVWISSFYTYIDLKDLWLTCDQLVGPCVRFFFSWTQAITTYVSEMKLYDHPYLISLGTGTIVALISALVYHKYDWFHPLVTTCSVPVNWCVNYFWHSKVN